MLNLQRKYVVIIAAQRKNALANTTNNVSNNSKEEKSNTINNNTNENKSNDTPIVGPNFRFSSGKFYENQFIPLLVRILKTYRLSCIVTKPIFYQMQLDALESEWRIGVETLGPTWQKLVLNYRILCRKANQAIQQKQYYQFKQNQSHNSEQFAPLYEARFMSSATNTTTTQQTNNSYKNNSNYSNPMKTQCSYYYSVQSNGIIRQTL